MISLAAAAKAGAVCMALVSDHVLICTLRDAPDVTLVCMKDGCRTPAEIGRLSPVDRTRFEERLYGITPSEASARP